MVKNHPNSHASFPEVNLKELNIIPVIPKIRQYQELVEPFKDLYDKHADSKLEHDESLGNIKIKEILCPSEGN